MTALPLTVWNESHTVATKFPPGGNFDMFSLLLYFFFFLLHVFFTIDIFDRLEALGSGRRHKN